MDLRILARQKAEASRTRPIQGLNPQSKHSIKKLSQYENATRPPVIVRAFRRVGISGTESKEYQMDLVKVDRDLAKGVGEYPLNNTRETGSLGQLI
jgi:hypothetical protein